MNYPEPKYPRGMVDLAGDTLIDQATDLDAYEHALQIINNWRSCHHLPLRFFRVWLTRIATQVDPTCLIAQRIKRLPAIKLKLELLRRHSVTLSEMQDIGGCRVVVKNLAVLNQLVRSHERSQVQYKLDYKDDYIERPKNTGYRGIHLIYRYRSEQYNSHNDLRVEIQLRSPLQHAWATAVETVGLVTGEALKSNLGSNDWRRFFALMGTAIAMREKATLVPGTPHTRKEVVAELRDCVSTLDAQTRLRTYSAMLRMPRHPGLEQARYFLLEFDSTAQKILVTGYANSQLNAAHETLLEVERALAARPEFTGSQAVLVSVGSLASLKRAYPNYFLDMRVFIEEVARALTSHPE